MSTWYLVLDGQYNQGGLLHKRSSFYFHTKLHQTGNGKITLEETYQNSSVEIIQRKNKTLFGTNLNLGTGGTEHKGAEIGDKETEESTRLGTNRQERQSHPLEGKTSQDDKRSWRLEDNKSDKQRGEISESLKAHTKKLRNNTYTQDATIPTFTGEKHLLLLFLSTPRFSETCGQRVASIAHFRVAGFWRAQLRGRIGVGSVPQVYARAQHAAGPEVRVSAVWRGKPQQRHGSERGDRVRQDAARLLAGQPW